MKTGDCGVIRYRDENVSILYFIEETVIRISYMKEEPLHLVKATLFANKYEYASKSLYNLKNIKAEDLEVQIHCIDGETPYISKYLAIVDLEQYGVSLVNIVSKVMEEVDNKIMPTVA